MITKALLQGVNWVWQGAHLLKRSFLEAKTDRVALCSDFEQKIQSSMSLELYSLHIKITVTTKQYVDLISLLLFSLVT